MNFRPSQKFAAWVEEKLGTMKPGERLPTDKSLARSWDISQMTVKRILVKFRNSGRIRRIPGKGTFVAVQNQELLREKKMKIVEEKLAQAVSEAHLMGVGFKELADMLRLLYMEKE